MELDKEIIVALITAGSAIVVAIIGKIGRRMKSAEKKNRSINIEQNATGRNNTQIGIQVTESKEGNDDAR